MADVDSMQLALLDDERPAFEFGARTLAETQLLAAGLVPSVMKAQAMAMLAFDDLLWRNSQKPVRVVKRRRA